MRSHTYILYCARLERNYRRLVEMCLKRQCSAYTQSRVFEAMLEFQVHQNILRGAAETVRCAKSLDIKITVDYLHMYYRAKTTEVKDRQKTGFQNEKFIQSKINIKC